METSTNEVSVQNDIPSSSSIRATVLICTRNRADSLARTLQSIEGAGSQVQEAWELVIVDNGGSDHTSRVVDGFRTSLPIRSISEERAGLSNARNAGVAASQGTYIIWTDDDVLVDAGWLAAYFQAFDKHADAAIFGGRTVPVFEEPAKAWFSQAAEHLQSLLAVRDEPSWKVITTDRVPYGLNYAVRAEEQQRFLYNPELGVAPGRRRGGEETAVIRAILADGATGHWVPDAVVRHLIPTQRQSVGYIYQFYRAQGFDYPLKRPSHQGVGIAPVSSHFVSALRKTIALGVRRLLGDPRWVASLVGLARVHGSLDRLSRNKVAGGGGKGGSEGRG